MLSTKNNSWKPLSSIPMGSFTANSLCGYLRSIINWLLFRFSLTFILHCSVPSLSTHNKLLFIKSHVYFPYAWTLSIILQIYTLSQGVLYTTLCDKVCQWLAACQWFSPGTPISSTNKTDCRDITEMLLKVALNTTTPTLQIT